MARLNYLLGGLLLIFMTSSCHFHIDDDDGGFFNCEKGKGSVITQEFDLSNFDGIELDLSADVFVTQGANFKILVEGEENIIDELDLEVDGTILEIKTNDCIRDYQLKFFITMPEIEELKIDGSGDIIGQNTFQVDDIKLDIDGSGNIDIELEADDIETKIDGSGEVILDGFADRLDFKISGSGDITAFGLESRRADIQIEGSGNVDVFVQEELNVKIEGSGDVRYKGFPVIDITIDGSGDLIDAN